MSWRNDPRRYGRKNEAADDVLDDRRIAARTSAVPLILKEEDGAPEGSIEGYGSVFGVVDTYGEVVQPGAFARSIKRWAREKKSKLKMLLEHREPIGVWDEMYEDDRGLYLKGRINLDVPIGQQTLSQIRFGSLEGLSIGYYEEKADPWGTEPRKLIQLDLRETSVVTFPANRESKVDAYKACLAAGGEPTIREIEGMLHERCGISLRRAKAWAGAIVRSGARDVADEPTSVITDEVIALLKSSTLKLPSFD